MKKTMIISVVVLLLFSSCGTYEGAGAYTGAQFGSIIGSAIGGITGGPRGHDVGTLAGMVGGAMVGAAIGKAADDSAERQQARIIRRHSRADEQQPAYDASGFDPSNGGDDRITFDNSSSGYPPEVAPSAPAAPAYKAGAPLVIRQARLFDSNDDGALSRGEKARVVFEVFNPTSETVYNVQPAVAELTGNRHVHISEDILVEAIAPQQAIRYTANVKADDGLRNGEVIIKIGVFQNNKEVLGQSKTFTIATRKR